VTAVDARAHHTQLDVIGGADMSGLNDVSNLMRAAAAAAAASLRP